jgi:hypothetical protein
LRHGSYSRRRYRSRGSTWTGLRRSHRAQPHGASRFDGCYVAQCDAKGSSRCVYDSGFSLMERGDGARLGCGRHRPSLDEDVHCRGPGARRRPGSGLRFRSRERMLPALVRSTA